MSILKELHKIGKTTTAQIVAAMIHDEGISLRKLHTFFYLKENTIDSAVRNNIYNALMDIRNGMLNPERIPRLQINKPAPLEHTLKVKRITPPVFKVGRYKINEYELRNLMLEVARGEKPSGIVVKDSTGTTATVLENGSLSNNLKGLELNSLFTLEMLKIRRENGKV